MKVCIVSMTGSYPLDIGGPAPVAYFLARELNRLKVDVYMFIRADNEKVKRLKKTNEIKRLNGTKLIPINIQYNKKTFMNIPFVFQKISETNNKLRDIIQDVDIIFYNSPPVDITLSFPLIARRASKKQVLAVHGGVYYEGSNLFRKGLLYAQKNWFDTVVPVSEFSREVAENFGYPKNNIKVIPNGVDTEIIDDSRCYDLDGNPKILYVGRLALIKDIETLLRAFSIFLSNYPNAQLYIVGHGPQKINLMELSNSLGIRDKVHFEGFIPPGTDVLKYYRSCDLYIMTSKHENFPLTILEAMGSKIPIICTDIPGGPRELIKNGINGFLFPVGDYKTLAKRMIKFSNSEHLRREFTAKNYSIIKKSYSWDKIAMEYKKIFDELI